ncbi:WLS protein, partial [Xiphorhynchus elegans]|nr:WLS protein [Xiphorhynchus elegans]
ENAEITLDVSLAYRDDTFSEWEEIAHAIENRKLKCTFSSPKTLESEGRHYDCDFLPFMEIGSVAHKYYLINIRLPSFSPLFHETHREGGATWRGSVPEGLVAGGDTSPIAVLSLSMLNFGFWASVLPLHTGKRCCFCLSRVIFALGISMTFINIPVEWFSIGFDWTWMLLFGDIRQGIFYAMLLSFWIIFCGEHMM